MNTKKDCIKSIRKTTLNKRQRLHWIKKTKLNQKLKWFNFASNGELYTANNLSFVIECRYERNKYLGPEIFLKGIVVSKT